MTIPEEQSSLSEIKAKVDHTVAKALGPHMDTPIYDQLVREYGKQYRTYNYFDTALAEKLQRIGQQQSLNKPPTH